jgi:hypothetical protein
VIRVLEVLELHVLGLDFEKLLNKRLLFLDEFLDPFIQGLVDNVEFIKILSFGKLF